MTLLPDTPLRPAPPWRDPLDPTPLRMILRHPVLLLALLGVCLAVGYLYARNTTPLYTSSAALRVEPGAPRVIGTADAQRGSDETIAFLNAEATVLTSAPVLEAALANPALHGRKAVSAPDPIGTLKKGLRVAVGRKDEIITIEFDAASPDDAAAVVNAVQEAYIANASRQQDQTDEKLLTILAAERSKQQAEAQANRDEMLQILKQAGTPNLDSRDQGQEIAAMKASLRAAQTDAAAAQTQYNEAVAALGGDAALLHQLELMNAAHSVPTNADLENSEVRMEIMSLELKKQEMIAGRTYLPSNPNLVGLQQQLDHLRLTYAASAHGRMAAAQERATQLQASVKEQAAVAQDLAVKSARYAQADIELKRLDRHLDQLDDRINELKASRNSGALRVTVVESARPALRPSKPDVPRILALAGVVGLALGCMTAYGRESALLGALAAKRRAEPNTGFVEDALEMSPDVTLGTRVTLKRRVLFGRSRPAEDEPHKIMRSGER